jgi:hypothetical protein
VSPLCASPGFSVDNILEDYNNPNSESARISDDEAFRFLYQPQLDDWTRELATLNSVRCFTDHSPCSTFNFYELFPKASDHIFTLAMGSDGLRHSLIALGTIVRDLIMGSGPSESYFLRKTNSLQTIQRAISNDAIDDTIFMSVMLQMGSDSHLGNLSAAFRHLQGLHLIHQYLQMGNNGKSTTFSPLARFTLRIASRIDFAAASMLDNFPQWPPFTSEDEVEDRKWLNTSSGITKDMSRHNIEWALASFEIDNLLHRTYRFAKRSDIYRTSGDPNAEEKVRLEYQELTQQFQAWKQRDVIIQQEEIEHFARQNASPSTDPFLKFLWHEPLHIHDRFYAKLLNQWRAGWIQASTIVHPFTGPETQGNRFQMAVDICRTHAALGEDGVILPSWQCLFFAGLAFGGMKVYPRECGWILERCLGIATAFPVVTSFIDGMLVSWEAGTVHWNAMGRVLPSAELTLSYDIFLMYKGMRSSFFVRVYACMR